MDTSTLSQNGLPKELASIPAGQIFILTNPHLGITSDNITHIQGIFSIAKRVNKRKDVIVNALPGEWSELMGCYVCKVGQEVLLADNDSLVEMLCEFWGLDFDEVCKTITIVGRNSKGRKAITFGGDTHPMRLPVPVKTPEVPKEEPDFGISLGYRTIQTRDSVLGDIRSILQTNISHELGVSVDDIIAIYKEVEKSRKEYRLAIKINRVKGISGTPSIMIENCDISLIDNKGNQYPLLKKPKEEHWDKHWDPQWIALYFTFILFKDGIRKKDLGDKNYYNVFKKILGQFEKSNKIPTPDTVVEQCSSKISNIKASIMNATDDTYAVEQFCIDGFEGEPYNVIGATDKDRELIKREFGIE